MFNSNRRMVCPELQPTAIRPRLTNATGAIAPVFIAILLVGCAKPPPEPASVAKSTETTSASDTEAINEAIAEAVAEAIAAAMAETPVEAARVEELVESPSEPPAEVAAGEDAEVAEEQPIVLTAKLFGMTREQLAAKNLTVESARELLAASEHPQPSECDYKP
jgi:hypothetical protein